jgi:hypothetical protein
MWRSVRLLRLCRLMHRHAAPQVLYAKHIAKQKLGVPDALLLDEAAVHVVRALSACATNCCRHCL